MITILQIITEIHHLKKLLKELKRMLIDKLMHEHLEHLRNRNSTKEQICEVIKCAIKTVHKIFSRLVLNDNQVFMTHNATPNYF